MPTTSTQQIHSYGCVLLARAKPTFRTSTRFCTYKTRSPGYGLLCRCLLPRRYSWHTEQHQEVPVHSSTPCTYGPGVHALKLYGRIPAAQPQHGRPRGQIQPTRLCQCAVPLSSFRRGELWLEEEHGPDLSPKGQHQGRNHPLRMPGLEFSPFTRHATCPWKDDRLVLSAYTPLRANRLALSDIDHLVSLGFNL